MTLDIASDGKITLVENRPVTDDGSIDGDFPDRVVHSCQPAPGRRRRRDRTGRRPCQRGPRRAGGLHSRRWSARLRPDDGLVRSRAATRRRHRSRVLACQESRHVVGVRPWDFPNIGPIELIIILAVLLLVVGPRRLPEMGQAVGKTIREFRKASTDLTDAATVTPDAKSVSPAAAATVTAAASASPAPVPAPAELPAPAAFPAPGAAPEPASDPLTAAPLPDAPPTDAPAETAPLPSNDAVASPGTDTTDDPSRQA